MTTMTTTRQQILNFLRTYITEHGWSPTYNEICDEVGLASANGARKHVVSLAQAGYLTMEPLRTGRIRLTSPAPDGWEQNGTR